MAERLTAEGHVVLTPDLPGHGDDRRPLPEMTMAAYVDRIAGILENQPDEATLVGHGMSGAVIAQAAERHPPGETSVAGIPAGGAAGNAGRGDEGAFRRAAPRLRQVHARQDPFLPADATAAHRRSAVRAGVRDRFRPRAVRFGS